MHCIIGYYGTIDGVRLAVIVGTMKTGHREFHYALPRKVTRETGASWVAEATPEMIAAVRAYGLRDGMPDGFAAGE